MIKVKKLVWKSHPDDTYLVSSCHEYTIKDLRTNKHFIGNLYYEVERYYFYIENRDFLSRFATLEEAKQHVQQEWDEYILSLIEVE